jgi:hypothetical protein
LAVRLGEAYVRAGDVREWGGRDLRAKLLFPREASLLRFFLQQRVPDVGTVLLGDVCVYGIIYIYIYICIYIYI